MAPNSAIFHKRGREEVLKFVKGLYGFGDYAAGNVAMLLGFYEDVPMDSETVSAGSSCF